MSDSVPIETVKDAVRDTYGRIARRVTRDAEQENCCSPARPISCCEPVQPASCCSPTQPASCCGPTQTVECAGNAAARFYSTEEIRTLPDTVTQASLGCGNPLAISELQQGEVVLDLGSGGGIDCFLAAQQVGPEGRVIGLDMTPDMIKLARRNAKQVGLTNVEFRFGEMEDIPLPGESVDAIISNCVINLSPDKDAVFAEAYRVLRPGGRLNVSDIVLEGELPPAIRDRLDAWASCVAGALQESEYLSIIRAAGFEEVEVLSRDHAMAEQIAESVDVKMMMQEVGSQASEDSEAMRQLGEAGICASEVAAKVASIKVRARKPV